MSYYIVGRQRRLPSPQFGQGTRRVVRLPVSTMKIDRSLVSDITSDPRSRVLIEAALWIAARLEPRSVADGLYRVPAVGCSADRCRPTPSRNGGSARHRDGGAGVPQTGTTTAAPERRESPTAITLPSGRRLTACTPP